MIALDNLKLNNLDKAAYFLNRELEFKKNVRSDVFVC